MNDKINPANAPDVAAIPEGYIPMSAPMRRLQVPDKPGFVRHWFRGDAGRIQRALQAGYKHVDPAEVKVNNFDVGGGPETSGNTDLGTRVSVAAGDGDEKEAGRLYLMEIPQHLYEYAQTFIAERNESVAAALRGGTIGDEQGNKLDNGRKYLKNTSADLFTPKIRRR